VRYFEISSLASWRHDVVCLGGLIVLENCDTQVVLFVQLAIDKTNGDKAYVTSSGHCDVESVPVCDEAEFFLLVSSLDGRIEVDNVGL